MNNILLSICIPSYNRVNELKRLLESIDVNEDHMRDIEIVIREDMSPNRDNIKNMVENYKKQSSYVVNYSENKNNYGYDKNIRLIAKSASGKWVMFMGDDDLFIPGALDQYLDFLREHNHVGYVLRKYKSIYDDGTYEDFRYAKENVFFNAGEQSIVELFRRSVFISGFCYRKECFSDYDCSDYDGTLLFQQYILACVCNKYESCYCDVQITESIEGGVSYFGKSESEKKLYDAGKNTVRNSVNFLKQVGILTNSIDKKMGLSVSDDIMISYSKYSYGFLHRHRNDGIRIFNNYTKELIRMGFARTHHFYLCYFALLILGKERCKKVIMMLKRINGSTPRL